MAKKELVSFCKPEETPAFGGVIHFKNPRYFYEHESIPQYCTHFCAKDERVRKAYLAAGKIEYGKEQDNGVQKEERKEEKVAFVEDKSEVSDVEDTSVNVEDMTWPELKSYASKLTDEKIKNKEHALQVVAENS